MSHIRFKLESAKYFLDQMRANIEIPKIFAFNLSAFLSDARSVTLFMQSEFTSYSGFVKWYKPKREEMENDEVFKFFKSLRNITIHQKPIVPRQTVTIYQRPKVPYSECEFFVEGVSLGTYIAIHSPSDGAVVLQTADSLGKVYRVFVGDSSKQQAESEKNKSSQEPKTSIKHLWYIKEFPEQGSEISSRDSWYFEERPQDDLLKLCDEYMQKLEKLVEECERLFYYYHELE